jgi:hypothetical protein
MSGTENPILCLTDGEIYASLVAPEGYGIHLIEWLPATRGLRDDSKWTTPMFQNGRWPQYIPEGNQVESFKFAVSARSQDDLVAELRNLDGLLAQAAHFWTSRLSVPPVYLMAKASNETNVRYAIVYYGRREADPNPFDMATVKGDCQPVAKELTLALEHGPWLATPPGTGEVCTVNTQEVIELLATEENPGPVAANPQDGADELLIRIPMPGVSAIQTSVARAPYARSDGALFYFGVSQWTSLLQGQPVLEEYVHNAALHLRNVRIPQGAIVKGAHLRLCSWDYRDPGQYNWQDYQAPDDFVPNDFGSAHRMVVRISAEAADDAAPFLYAYNGGPDGHAVYADYAARPRTSYSAEWFITDTWANWGTHVGQDIDIGPVLSAVVGRAGWVSGNGINLFIDVDVDRTFAWEDRSDPDNLWYGYIRSVSPSNKGGVTISGEYLIPKPSLYYQFQDKVPMGDPPGTLAIVANHHRDAGQIDSILQYVQATDTYTEVIDSDIPYLLFPENAAVGDAVYFGCASYDKMNTFPFENLIFNLRPGNIFGTPLLKWEYSAMTGLDPNTHMMTYGWLEIGERISDYTHGLNDHTFNFTDTGLNSVNWICDRTTTRPFPEYVPPVPDRDHPPEGAIRRYWVRATITYVGIYSPTIKCLAHPHIATNNAVTVDYGEVRGDLPALISMSLENISDRQASATPPTTIQDAASAHYWPNDRLCASWFAIGLRNYERGVQPHLDFYMGGSGGSDAGGAGSSSAADGLASAGLASSGLPMTGSDAVSMGSTGREVVPPGGQFRYPYRYPNMPRLSFRPSNSVPFTPYLEFSDPTNWPRGYSWEGLGTYKAINASDALHVGICSAVMGFPAHAKDHAPFTDEMPLTPCVQITLDKYRAQQYRGGFHAYLRSYSQGYGTNGGTLNSFKLQMTVQHGSGFVISKSRVLSFHDVPKFGLLDLGNVSIPEDLGKGRPMQFVFSVSSPYMNDPAEMNIQELYFVDLILMPTDEWFGVFTETGKAVSASVVAGMSLQLDTIGDIKHDISARVVGPGWSGGDLWATYATYAPGPPYLNIGLKQQYWFLCAERQTNSAWLVAHPLTLHKVTLNRQERYFGSRGAT